MAYGKKLFKMSMNKAIIDNMQMTRKFQDQWDNYPAKMGDLDSNIDKLILFYCNITMMLRTRGRVISPSDGIALLLRSFLYVKDEVFREYM